MKKVLFSMVLVVSVYSGSAMGQESFAAQVEEMWRAGNYAGVMAIAQQRLAANTNDLPGLLLKHEYEVEFLQLDAATNTAAEIIRVAPQIESERFAEVRALVIQDAEAALELLPQYPPDELAADWLTVGTMTNNHLPSGYAIQALEEDGYFTGSPPTSPTPPSSAPN